MNGILYAGGFWNYSPSGPNGYVKEGCVNVTKLDLKLYQCPADDGPPRGGHYPNWTRNSERSSFDHFGNSCACNQFFTSYVGGGPVYSNSPYLRPTSRVPSPSRTLSYEENIGRLTWQAKREKNDCISVLGNDGIDPGPTKVIRGWHGKDSTYNRAFVDGHASTQRILIEGTGDANGYFNPYHTELVWSDDLDLQERHKCIVVRGPGRQKDTLPTGQIPTGLQWNQSGRVSSAGCAASISDE